MRADATKILDEKGFALTIVLVLVLGIGLASAVLLPRVMSWQHAAMIQHETDCLVSDLRLMQQMTRTSDVYPIEDVSEHRLRDSAPELELRDHEHAYVIWRRTFDDSRPKASMLLRHDYPAELTISSNIKGRIRFGSNGGTANATTISIFYTGEMEKGKNIILDSVGRIRVEAIHGKATP